MAITLLIKNPAKVGKPCTIHYWDIGDYLDRNEKLQIIAEAEGFQDIQWQIIVPNEKHDWIDQRDGEFDKMLPIGDKSGNKSETIFVTYSLGVASGRDVWCYNFSRKRLGQNMGRMIDFYNKQVDTYKERKEWDKEIAVDDFVVNDPVKISWDRGLKKELEKLRKCRFEKSSIMSATYRPFCKTHIYFNRQFNGMVYQMPKIFPEPGMENLVVSIMTLGEQKEFSTVVTNVIPDLHYMGTTQCFPLYTYEKADSETLIDIKGERFGNYIRRENISDQMLQKFREHYSDKKITKEDIFYYVYGILHSHSYRERFAADLKKQLPRIPMVDDFKAFSQAGRKLAELHLNYETGKMYSLKEVATGSVSFKVNQMGYPSKSDKSKIIYNGTLTLDGIPDEAYRYIVNGKSALDWIVERYAVTTHKDSGIKNDPNDWCEEIGDERYIVDLIKRIVHLSVESVKIIDALPELTF